MPKSSKTNLFICCYKYDGSSFFKSLFIISFKCSSDCWINYGVTLGIIYFIITSVARDVGLVEWILNWPIIKYFMLKILIIIFIKHLLKNMKFIYNLEEKEMKHYCQLLLVMKKFNQYLKRYITWRIDKKVE